MGNYELCTSSSIPNNFVPAFVFIEKAFVSLGVDCECMHLQVSEDGALLVRPDGHVAWRCARLPRPPDALSLRQPPSLSPIQDAHAALPQAALSPEAVALGLLRDAVACVLGMDVAACM